ncbi:MAG: quinate 5-dehydrogenase [Chloroflexi bacterium]|nr:quinate 5-dehydrogenase [Chloroflexota bacterium]MCI0645034.1 quinate 5-dehydrogenase [Chloroflexota bacterium]MCI0725609.1 quinate 5-dehydrogenase [Chloroflexota bacterium]
MKRAVSVSLGSSKRDKQVEVELLGQCVAIERRGTDGDVDRATALFTELDGQVDALGVGGIDLWVHMGDRRYPLHAAQKLVKNVRRTPVVDGSGLKNTLERQVVPAMVEALGPSFQHGRVLLTAAVDRYGMTLSFFESGYEVVCADLMFALGLPIPIRRFSHLKWLARLLVPVVVRLPISVLYPTGEKQEQIVPKFTKWYQWATVIAGDCHYIKRHMPDDLQDKVIVTNTTTETDMALFRERGVKTVVTTTPILEGRSFGTNMMEAALTAVSGKNRALSFSELERLVADLRLKPTVHHL